MKKLLFVFLVGCGASVQEAIRARRAEIAEQLDPGIGKYSDVGFARSWGPPDRRDVIGDSEFWTYVTSYGTRRQGSAYTNPYTNVTTYNGRDVERSDKIVLEFRDGLLVSWRADIRR